MPTPPPTKPVTIDEMRTALAETRRIREAEELARQEALAREAKAREKERQLMDALRKQEEELAAALAKQEEKERLEREEKERLEKEAKEKEDKERKEREKKEKEAKMKEPEEGAKKKEKKKRRTAQRVAVAAITNAEAGPSRPRPVVVVPTLASVQARRQGKATEASESGSSRPSKRPRIEDESEGGSDFEGSVNVTGDEEEEVEVKYGMHRCTRCILYDLECVSSKKPDEGKGKGKG